MLYIEGYKNISEFYQLVLDELINKKDIESTINAVISNTKFKYINVPKDIVQTNNSSTQQKFNTNQKSEIYIRDALKRVPRCKICNGLIHKNSISIDHIKRKQDGGIATLDNGQITHPYCNSTYKN